jgi:hypothetical protein
MADSEWYRVTGYANPFPNQESAFEAAEASAPNTDEEVEVIRHTETVIRCYKRQVTVTSEDMPTAT